MATATEATRRRTTKPQEIKGRGRPSKITDKITVGTRQVPVTDRIIELVGVGVYVEQAAASCGIAKATVYDWIKQGARINVELTARKRTRSTLKAAELHALEFSYGVDQAYAEWEIRANLDLQRLAQGGIVGEVITEKRDADDKLIERTTRKETTLPDGATIRWRLERKHPDRYGRRLAIEGVEDGAPIKVEDRVTGILELLEQAKAAGL